MQQVALAQRCAHLWSGLGFPFFLMLLAVVSLKCSRPRVTLVILPLGRLTLWRSRSEFSPLSLPVHRDQVQGPT